MSINVSEVIRQAIVQENHDFVKVISDVANGCKLEGFFNRPNWKIMLERCFERKRIGLTDQEIQIYSSVLSDPSGETTFANGMNADEDSTSSTDAAGPSSRNKRSSTSIDEGRRRDMTKRFRSARSSLDEKKLKNMLDDINNVDWTESAAKANAKQRTVKYVTILEKVNPKLEAVQHPAANATEKQLFDRISKRRNAIYKPHVKRPSPKPAVRKALVTQVSVEKSSVSKASVQKTSVPQAAVKKVSVPKASVQKASDLQASFQKASAPQYSIQKVSIPQASAQKTSAQKSPAPKVAKVAETVAPANTNSSDVDGTPGVPVSAVLKDITNQRTTRRQTQLLLAYSGINITERRDSTFVRRTSVLFTMIDVLKYKDVLDNFNIFVTDNNEKHDYVIAEKICRSAKFLSAIVSGKPIISLDWIRALKISSNWLDPLNYLLKDEDGENHYNFNMSNTLKLVTESNKKLFMKHSVLVTPNAEIGPNALKGVIFSGGGKFLKTTLVPRKGDSVICVSHITDKNMWPRLQRKYPALQQIISTDGLVSMIFRNTHDVSEQHVLHEC